MKVLVTTEQSFRERQKTDRQDVANSRFSKFW